MAFSSWYFFQIIILEEIILVNVFVFNWNSVCLFNRFTFFSVAICILKVGRFCDIRLLV